MGLTWKYVRLHAVGELGSSFGCVSWFSCGTWFQKNSSSSYIFPVLAALAGRLSRLEIG